VGTELGISGYCENGFVWSDFILKKGPMRTNDSVKTSTGRFFVLLIRVADPHSFHPDPDPAFEAEYRSGSESNTDPDLIRIQGFNVQKLQKNYS
jgi:hypothetical protein